jgi:hypothetical protein
MAAGGLRYVRKKDFQIEIVLNPDDPERAAEFTRAVHVAKPTFLTPRLTLEIYQPLAGMVHETLYQICHNGVQGAKLTTRIPDRPDIEDPGHVAFYYENGRAIHHETVMSKDAMDYDDFMVHHLVLEFLSGTVAMSEWTPDGNVVRPVFADHREGQGNPR